MNAPVVFLDKDGTLVENVPYNVDPERITLAAGAASGLRRLARAGYHFVVVSNQSGVARGYFKEDDLQVVTRRLRALFHQAAGICLDGFYYCPHHPQGVVPRYSRQCKCRKPQPGMLLTAAKELEINLKRSWMVGDILDDVEAGNRAGCRTVLLDNGNETVWQAGPYRKPDFTTASLAEAAEVILSQAYGSLDIARNEIPPIQEQ